MNSPVAIVTIAAPDRALDPVRELSAGLLQPRAAIASKYFYDAAGSRLFEAITRTPEYYPTRTEAAIVRHHGAAIARKVGAGRTAIELGAGNCEKARTWCALLRPRRYLAVDISAEHLRAAVRGLRGAVPGVEVRALAADLTRTVELPDDIPSARRLVLYPGSSIGNFDPDAAQALLARTRRLLDADGMLLIGIDLTKDSAVIDAAYNDRQGVTARFNRNVLNHVNHLLGSDFEPAQWHHRARFDAPRSRLEMHLEAACALRVRWPGGTRDFARGERIHTENSYKYRIEDFTALLARSGFGPSQVWTDPARWFAVVLAGVA